MTNPANKFSKLPRSSGKRLTFLHKILLESGEKAKSFYKKPEKLEIGVKEDGGLYSNADVSVEKLLKKRIHENYPEEFFLGEEEAAKGGEKEFEAKNPQKTKKNKDFPDFYNTSAKIIDKKGCWVVDPIDGTNNFLNGFDYWSVSVAFVRGKKILVGGVYNPIKKELFIAEKGKGAYLNGEKLPKFPKKNDPSITIGLGIRRSDSFEHKRELLKTLQKEQIVISLSSCCSLTLCGVARQTLKAHYLSSIRSWDCLAGCLLTQEVGAQQDDFLCEIEKDGLLKEKRLLVAHPQHFERLKEIFERLKKSLPQPKNSFLSNIIQYLKYNRIMRFFSTQN